MHRSVNVGQYLTGDMTHLILLVDDDADGSANAAFRNIRVTTGGKTYKIGETNYLWGLDFSGSLQGAAGGVGGLLAVTRAGQNYYPTYDGNGNVSEYVDVSGVPVAHYEYESFGKAIDDFNDLENFSFRYSSKYFDSEIGLYYYGYRYYLSDVGRWLNRDPIGEWGGLNLYGMLDNDGLNRIDRLGLSSKNKPLPIVTFPVPIVPPSWNPGFWEKPGVENRNNCWNYACDTPKNDFDPTNPFIGGGGQPGGGFRKGEKITCSALRSKVGRTRPAPLSVTSDEECPCNTHKIALFANDKPAGREGGGDFHFYRQDKDGGWSHKPGTMPVDQLPNPWSYKDYKHCGYRCVASQPFDPKKNLAPPPPDHSLPPVDDPSFGIEIPKY